MVLTEIIIFSVNLYPFTGSPVICPSVGSTGAANVSGILVLAANAVTASLNKITSYENAILKDEVIAAYSLSAVNSLARCGIAIVEELIIIRIRPGLPSGLLLTEAYVILVALILNEVVCFTEADTCLIKFIEEVLCGVCL